MILVVVLCAAAESANPGCMEQRIPLVVDVTPMACALKAQEVLAEKRVLFGGYQVARYGCERHHHGS